MVPIEPFDRNTLGRELNCQQVKEVSIVIH